MIQVERHFIHGTKEIVELCISSKELYNRCNFLMRQAWFSKQCLPDISILVRETKSLSCFKNLHNTKTAKQTIRKCISDWSNFLKSLNVYEKNPSKLIKKPRPPNYKNRLAQVIFFNETIKRKPRKQGLIVPTNHCFSIKSNKDFKQVVITPKTFGFIVEVQYEVEKEAVKAKVHKDRFCAIDLGVNNLCTITSDQHSPILVNGRIVKSINQWYNKNPCKSRSRKRYWRLENYFHHTSKMIVENCIKHGIGRIIIGRNEGWKQKSRIGRNNQQFQSIPFNLLQQKIQNKAKAIGIFVEFTEESYTSKASYLDRDLTPVYGENGSFFSGKRIKRGLYKTKNGILLNADANGSANIARKVIQDNESLVRLDRSLAARPVRINPLRKPVGEGLEVGSLNNQTCKFEKTVSRY